MKNNDRKTYFREKLEVKYKNVLSIKKINKCNDWTVTKFSQTYPFLDFLKYRQHKYKIYFNQI
jgi:hypothetical protein